MGSPRFIEDLVLIERFKPQVVITSVGQPGEVYSCMIIRVL